MQHDLDGVSGKVDSRSGSDRVGNGEDLRWHLHPLDVTGLSGTYPPFVIYWISEIDREPTDLTILLLFTCETSNQMDFI